MAFPANYDISYYWGDTYTFYVKPKDQDGNEIDLSAYTPSFAMATERGSSTLIPGSVSISGDTTLVCTISPTVGKTLDPTKQYVYDVQVANGVDNVYTYLTGTINITTDVAA